MSEGRGMMVMLMAKWLVVGFLAVIAQDPQSPHIVFMLLDDVGWNDVSFHGSSQIPTPHIDALAAQGVKLDNYYVNAVCSPTRASLLTGRSQMHHGIFTPFREGDNASGLNLTYTLLPQHLKMTHNYSTYMVGKWHLGMKAREYLPTMRGFDRFYGYYLGVTDYWKFYDDNGQDRHLGLELFEGGADLGHRPGYDIPQFNMSGQYSTRLFAQKAAEWIIEHGTSRVSQPMFMYLAFQGAHSANNKFVQAPNSTIAEFAHISPDETCGQYELPGLGQCSKVAMRKTVAATVSELDMAIESVTTALKRAGLWNETLLVVSSDNGGPVNLADNNMLNNFPLRGCKGGYYEGGIRAVGFIHGAGIAPNLRGTVSRSLHHITDWLPTLLAAAGGGMRHEVSVPVGDDEIPFQLGDGVNNWASLSTGAPSARSEIAHVTQAEGSVLLQHALRVGDLKLVQHPWSGYCDMAGWHTPPGLLWNYTRFTVECGPPPDRLEIELRAECSWSGPCLFNITADPCEYNDLAKSRPQDVERLQRRLAEYKNTTVLSWANFSNKSTDSDPVKHGPVTPIQPDIADGPHVYEGVWQPWMSLEEDAKHYPTHYVGPGY